MMCFSSRFRLRSSRWIPTLPVLLAMLVGADLVGAQELPIPDRPEDGVVDERDQSLHAVERPTEMSPAAGPPGTTVELEATLLPALTPMQVALGGTRFGFEALILTLTDEEGNLSVTVEIPEWAAHTRSHRFIIFNAYFTSVYAATPLFHVTDAEGMIRREGEVTWTGPECVTLTTADDEIYDLVGDLGDLDLGDQVTVKGWIVDSPEVAQRVEENCPDEGMILQVAEVEDSLLER